MRRIATFLVLMIVLSACAGGSAGQRAADGAATGPGVSPEQIQASMCEHLIDELEPLWDEQISVDAGVSKQWLDLAVVLEQDAIAYQGVSDAGLATELSGVADAAYGIATVTDPRGGSTQQEVHDAQLTLKRQVQQLAVALPEDACIDHDRAAQSSLRNGLVAAITAMMDAESAEITPADIEKIEPSLAFVGDKPATVDTVSINMMADDQVVMSILSETGRAFCIGHDPDVTVYGTIDAVGARSLSDCGDSKAWPA